MKLYIEFHLQHFHFYCLFLFHLPILYLSWLHLRWMSSMLLSDYSPGLIHLFLWMALILRNHLLLLHLLELLLLQDNSRD